MPEFSEQKFEVLNKVVIHLTDVFWQWAFWLTFASITRLMWNLFEGQPSGGIEESILVKLTLTNAAITVILKIANGYCVTSKKARRKTSVVKEVQNERNRVRMVLLNTQRSVGTCYSSSRPLAFQKAIRLKTRG